MNEKWYKSVVVLLGTIMIIIQAITMIFMVGVNPDAYTYMQKLVQSFIAVSMAGLSIIFMMLSLKKRTAGPILGMIVGLEYTFNYTIVNVLVGFALFAFCLGLLVKLSQEPEVKTKEAKEVKTENKKEKVEEK